MKRFLRSFAAALAAALLLAPICRAQIAPPWQPKATILKYSQPIRHVIDPAWPNDMLHWGENIWSDVDWMKIMQSPTIEPNWVVADDFRDPFNTPVRTVRWWGSYNPQPGVLQQTPTGLVPVPPGPGVEDGYVISFFRDIPATPTSPSRPGDLLGTYVLPIERVDIVPTPYQGWDMHPIFEYRANLMDAHLDHAITPWADSMGFNQKAGEVYWISIIAEVGHRLRLETIPGTNEDRWVSEPTGKQAINHYWGWHTSPVRFNDVASMGHLFMPGNQWEYFGWNPIQPQHYLLDMAFELYTIPEPATATLLAMSVALCLLRARRRNWLK